MYNALLRNNILYNVRISGLQADLQAEWRTRGDYVLSCVGLLTPI